MPRQAAGEAGFQASADVARMIAAVRTGVIAVTGMAGASAGAAGILVAAAHTVALVAAAHIG